MGPFPYRLFFHFYILLQYNLLKRKKWGKRLVRIPDLSKLEHMSYILACDRVPMLIIGLILGSNGHI